MRAEVCTKNSIRIVTRVEDSVAKRIAVLGIEKKIDLKKNTMKYCIFHSNSSLEVSLACLISRMLSPVE